jgi:transposase
MDEAQYELTDAQWARIAPFLRGKPGDQGRRGADNRQFVNGVLWVLRTGEPWHRLPPRYGARWQSVRVRFVNWAKGRIWERVFDELVADPLNPHVERDAALLRARRDATTGKHPTREHWRIPKPQDDA